MMSPEDIEHLAAELERWAQNEEMIDGEYLAHGLDCMNAANELRALLWCRKQTLALWLPNQL